MNAQIFDWKEYGNDIHIGLEKKLSEYEYKDYASRSEYYKAWYERKKLNQQNKQHGTNIRGNKK